MHKNQNGSGLVAIVVIVITVILVGVIVWRVMTPPSREVQTNMTAQQTESSQSPTQSSPYLFIKEWGVKIPLSSDAAGVYYAVDPDSQSSSDVSDLIVYSKDVDAMVGPQGLDCKGEYIAYIMRLPKNDPRWQPQEAFDDGRVSMLFKNRTDVGDYRYAVSTYRGYGAECFDTATSTDYQADQAMVRKFAGIAEAFMNDFKNIQTK